MDPCVAPAHVPMQMACWSMRPRNTTFARIDKRVAYLRNAKSASGYVTRSCAAVNVALADETPVYMLCKEDGRVANWRKAKHLSRQCSCSCAEASGALAE